MSDLIRRQEVKEILPTEWDNTEFSVVRQLPTTGETHIIYLFEKIGKWRDLEEESEDK